MSEKNILANPARVAQTRPPLNQRLMTHSTRGFPVKIRPYLIIVADAADAVSVNFFGQCKFLQI